MGKFLDKLLGIPEDGDDLDDSEELLEEERKVRRRGNAEPEAAATAKESEGGGFFGSSLSGGLSGKKQAQVVNVYSQKQHRVTFIKPRAFDESKTLAERLKARRTLVVNLEKIEEDVAQRIVDFISGATYALGGDMQKVGEGIFMFVPSNVAVEEERGARSTELEMPWLGR